MRILITGGASGIGLATARLAVARGARVAILDRDAAALRAARDALVATVAEAADAPVAAAASGGRVVAVEADVSDTAAVRRAVDAAAASLQGLTAVVNSAGVDLAAALDAIDDAAWDRALSVNLTGVMRVCRAAVPHLRRAGGGAIVNVASAAGLTPLAGRAGYCAAKAGVVMFGKALAMELATDGIRVNAVCPGAIDTPLFRTSYEDQPDPQAALAAIRARYALKRTAAPDEVAEAILFLAGPAAGYVTGIAMAVDGGRSFH